MIILLMILLNNGKFSLFDAIAIGVLNSRCEIIKKFVQIKANLKCAITLRCPAINAPRTYYTDYTYTYYSGIT